ncbi:hypothetical protein PF011_g21822, partial [Phytophthora fragariae]
KCSCPSRSLGVIAERVLRDLVEEATAAEGVDTNREAPDVPASANTGPARARDRAAGERTEESATVAAGSDARAAPMAGRGSVAATPGIATTAEPVVAGGSSQQASKPPPAKPQRRSGAGVKKPTRHVRSGQLGAKLVVTNRKPQRRRRWRQTEMTGFTTLRQQREEKELDQGTNTCSSGQSDATEIVVKLEPATDVGSEPTASTADTEAAERVVILEPRPRSPPSARNTVPEQRHNEYKQEKEKMTTGSLNSIFY